MISDVSEMTNAGCVQFCPAFGETTANIAKMVGFIENADLDLIVFPELATSGYEFKNRDEAFELALELDNGAEIAQFKNLSADTDTVLVFGFAERSGEKVYNSSALIEPDGSVTVYRKIHLFDQEKFRFDPGDRPPGVKTTKVGRIGMLICFDWIFPEVTRKLALDGAQLICHPSNLVLDLCQKSMFARSVENCVFTLTCNRTGTENRAGRELTFTGGSQILSTRGKTLAVASAEGEEVISAAIEPKVTDDKNLTSNNHILKDRRPEFYKGLE
ncbi:MAG: hypothetical protein HN356_09785 [Calditrichaeota bacterium]|nr:hypothetical protein [Calditrichota bacterium]MBT7790502.1 hypothetical protein [Calditrichota bacterium]